MKRFDIITETDARVLARGETVMLARRGHVTPLAQDTLSERRVTVVREGRASRRGRALAPPPKSGRSRSPATTRAWRCDGRSSRFCEAAAWRCRISGPTAASRSTIPTSRRRSRGRVARGEADAGIVIDGAGIGSAIAANKIDGVRAAMATTETIARYAREHNGANVLTLGATLRHAGRGAGDCRRPG